MTKTITVLSARCYASAVLAKAMCVYLYLSQVGVLSKCLDGSRSFLAWRLPSIYPTPCCTEIQVSSKIKFPLQLCLTLDFLHARHVDRRNVSSTTKVDA